MRNVPFVLLAGLGMLLTLGACENPTNVGMDLIGEQGGEPTIRTIEATSLEHHPINDVTGQDARILVGRVDDPAFGTVAATGYVDFAQPSNLSGGFRDNPVTSATLRLYPDYRYGDTTATVTYALRTVPQEWTATDAPADTTLPAGELIREFTFTASDTLVEVPLPADWISANDATLRSGSFADTFHGFQLAPVSGNAVLGFIFNCPTQSTTCTESRLRVATSADSASFFATKTLTTTRRPEAPDLPAARIGLQDGAGPAGALYFDLDVQEPYALNRAVFQVYADTLLQQQTPPHFVRPTIRQLELYAIPDEGAAIPVESATLDAEGRFTYRSETLRRLLQDVLLGNVTIERFELRIPPSSNTVNTVALYTPAAETQAPRAILTLTPIPQ